MRLMLFCMKDFLRFQWEAIIRSLIQSSKPLPANFRALQFCTSMRIPTFTKTLMEIRIHTLLLLLALWRAASLNVWYKSEFGRLTPTNGNRRKSLESKCEKCEVLI